MSDIREVPDIEHAVRAVPDYPLVDQIDVTTQGQMKAIADPTRSAIVVLLLERAATTTELALALGKPKGTVDHHLKVLANAGLVHVVRTRQVRAMTERFWGRTARTFAFCATTSDEPTPMWMVRDAHEEMARTLPAMEAASKADPAPGEGNDGEHDDGVFATFRHARIPADRVQEFGRRLYELSDEFVTTERGGDVMYGLLLALFPTDLPILPEATS
jgi:DNA-binding transcriptional ArsR family regulator